MKKLEQKITALFGEIGHLSPDDKRKATEIVDKLSAALTRKAALLNRRDLTDICGDAVREWETTVSRKRLGGLPLSQRDIQAVMWLKGIVLCLRRHGLLQRPVDIEWDR